MSAMDSPDFASLLRRYRRRSGLTQEELAERAGLSAASVSLLERGITLAPQRAPSACSATRWRSLPTRRRTFWRRRVRPQR